MTSNPIQSILDRAVGEGVAPGLSAAVLTPDRGVELLQAGVRGVADPAPMTADTVFWIASCTKALVATAALLLVDRGRLDLDEPVARLVPELAEPSVLTGFGPDGAPQLRPARRPITLRRLLSHTSGLAYDFNCPEIVRYLEHRGLTLATAGGLGLPLVCEPGETWRYGVGVDVAGLMIEAATGQALGPAMDELLLGPLGMADTTFDPSPEQAARCAGLHARAPNGLIPLPPIQPMPPSLRGGGGLISTAADYMRFLGAIVRGGDGVIPPRVMAVLTTPQLRSRSLGGFVSAQPQMSADYEPLPGLDKGWTLAFLQNLEPLPGGRSAGSLAWAGLANCYYWADPAAAVAGVLFAQLLPFADPGMLDLFDRFEQAAYAGQRPRAAADPAGVPTAAAEA